MAAPIVSVILPFFEAADTLDEAIASISAQTLCDWELIAFDDGSSDASLSIAQSWAARDARVRVFFAPHAGIVAALGRACFEARGGYLARMDADDIAHPERLEKQVALLEENQRIALCGTQIRMAGSGIRVGRRRYETWINGLLSPEELIQELFIECPIPHPTFCMRRDAYFAAGGYQEHGWPEDYDLVMRLWLNGGRFAKVPETLLDWRHSSGRLSMRDSRYDESAFRALKRHYLAAAYLRGRDTFHQWGAGLVGKRWLREWGSNPPAAVVDINTRKIGERIHGIPVIPPESLPPPGQTFIVIMVGTPGARDLIRAWLEPRGYQECRDFLFLA